MAALVATAEGKRLTGLRGSDVVMGMLFAVAICVALVKTPGPLTAAAAITELSCLVAIAWWDSRTLRAPNAAVAAGLALTLAFAVALGASSLWQAVAGSLSAFLAVGAVALAGRGAMGAGDVKYAALCGAVVGLRGVLPLLAMSAIAGGAIAGIVLLLRLRDRKDSMAFTPLLALGAVVTLAWLPVYLVR